MANLGDFLLRTIGDRKLDAINVGINKDIHLPEDFIKGLAIVCEDFSYQCQSFPVFGLKGNEIVKEIKNILSTYLPF